jgi:phosphoenolpyruvate carboxykinase (ATP)
MPLKYTRALINAIHNGELAGAEFETMPVFKLAVPTKCTGVPTEILLPSRSWKDQKGYTDSVHKLAGLFREAFKTYEAGASTEIKAAGPQV